MSEELKFVKKRDGSRVNYHSEKIVNAIESAALDLDYSASESAKIAQSVLGDVEDMLKKYKDENPRKALTVEVIQNAVSNALVKGEYFDVCESYTSYRFARDRQRRLRSSSFSAIDALCNADVLGNDGMRENANIDGHQPAGAMLQIGELLSSEYTSLSLLNPSVEKAERDGAIHIHDKSFYLTRTYTCLQVPLDKLFSKGYRMNKGTIRPPKSFRVAASLTANVIQTVQNLQHGGVSIPLYDYYLAPFYSLSFITRFEEVVNILYGVKVEVENKQLREELLALHRRSDGRILGDREKVEAVIRTALQGAVDISDDQVSEIFDKALALTEEECWQSTEGLITDLASMQSRCGAQNPFSSLNLGTDTSYEGRRVTYNMLKGIDAGLGHKESSLFPILIFKVKDGVNGLENDPNYDLYQYAIKVSAKRMYPTFEFLDAPFNLQYYKEGEPESEVATMGCVSSNALICYSIFDRKEYVSNFADLWEYLTESQKLVPTPYGENSWYIDLEKLGIVMLVRDSHDNVGEAIASNMFTRVRKVIMNKEEMSSPDRPRWYKISVLGPKGLTTLTMTDDHPLSVLRDGEVQRICARGITVNDRVAILTNPVGNDGPSEVFYQRVNNIFSLGRYEEPRYSFDVETTSDRFDVNGFASHNCRTRVIANVANSNYVTSIGRGNMSFTSISLPYIALEAKGNEKEFFRLLKHYMKLCKVQLLDRFKWQCGATENTFPFTTKYQHLIVGLDDRKHEESLEEGFINFSLSIGFVGLAECLVALTGKHHGESEESQALGLKIVGFMNDMCQQWSTEWYKSPYTHEKYHLNWGVLATPAEGLAGKSLRKARAKFGVVKGVTDGEYFTNSNHIPARYPISFAKKIELEAPYHALTPAGHICYVEVQEDIQKNLSAYEAILNYMKKCGVGYGSINVPLDYDPVCEYNGFIDTVCPCCGRDVTKPITQAEIDSIRSRLKLPLDYKLDC